ncbi:ANTAR domain-containing protein [Actinomycetospora rhizophila]|uniref:ANTAR domain-containing protein n=2 Tax=Actinomycetospora TaxID=402649 RepID=A0ABV9ZDP8_9PSEU|nr:ANTAR domain-containing protein [Actinomycetospora chibensis]MDD7923265.1 ANTAR domain-containing protein [Actinomycetospora chibensis]
MHRLVEGAVHAVPAADAGGVAELTDADARSWAATLPLVKELAHLAVATDEGPLVEAMEARPGAAMVTDLNETSTRRWPHWARRARTAGVGAVLTVVLPCGARRRTQLFSLYGPRPGIFDASSAAAAQAFAAPLAVALPAAHRAAALERALASRDVIGQAKGVLMTRQGIDSTSAFDHLVRLSQESNTRLPAVAARLVDEVETAAERGSGDAHDS